MASNQNPWGGDGKPTLSKKVSQKFDRTKDIASAGYVKTKAAASVGFEKTMVAAKKVKERTSAGVNWMKVKYNKSKLFQKK